ncbi:hypothetical protein [Pelagibacterium mangrovi]|uniref:hypothetical protein n=1 Tax=Pelagibacterium mangrovi TaxID=3119828 RepID=UPI002FCAEDB0
MAVRMDALAREVTREASTEVLYGKRVAMLSRRAKSELGYDIGLFDTIDCFALMHEEFKDATLRQYAAALAWAVDTAEETGELNDQEAAACRERLATRPVPRPRDAEKRTSGKKRKSVSQKDFVAVCRALAKRNRGEDKLLLRLLVSNMGLGLRPCEYHGATLTESMLVVRSAKATNGRALAEFREFELDDASSGQVESLVQLIEDINAAAENELHALIDRLGGRLRRVCRHIGVEPFSLYTTRHQAIANIKATGSAEEVAAFAGHNSIDTARKYYAPRRSAWKIDKSIKPTPRMVDLVEERVAHRGAKRRPKL